MSPGTEPVPVLVVEDNRRYGELIERMLGDDFAAERATTLGDAVARCSTEGATAASCSTSCCPARTGSTPWTRSGRSRRTARLWC